MLGNLERNFDHMWYKAASVIRVLQCSLDVVQRKAAYSRDNLPVRNPKFLSV